MNSKCVDLQTSFSQNNLGVAWDNSDLEEVKNAKEASVQMK